MPTITIPARDLHEGDEVILAGIPGYRVSAYIVAAAALYLERDGHAGVATIYDLHPDATVTVDRPDPDAEVVEAMAISLASSFGSVYTDETASRWLTNARAALAAYRKHTESTMQAALDDHRKHQA